MRATGGEITRPTVAAVSAAGDRRHANRLVPVGGDRGVIRPQRNRVARRTEPAGTPASTSVTVSAPPAGATDRLSDHADRLLSVDLDPRTIHRQRDGTALPATPAFSSACAEIAIPAGAACAPLAENPNGNRRRRGST